MTEKKRPQDKDDQADAAGDGGVGDLPSAHNPAVGDDRRSFLGMAGTAAMVGGLTAGYGTLGFCALRFLLPNSQQVNLGWQLVATIEKMRDVDSLDFVASSGARIVIARQREGDLAECFIALSSVCPHLGCQVHWENAKGRFFCPCHNGAFDPAGKATSGPPVDANQSLTQYPLKTENGVLYVNAPLKTVTSRGSVGGP